MDQLDKALLDPASFFVSPEAVVASEAFTREQKIQILRRWDYDARDLAVADEENMMGRENEENLLVRILAALHQLNAHIDLERAPPTKQGGEWEDD